MPCAASMRRSAATAICSPIWCGGSWKMAPIPRSFPSPRIRTCRSRKFCAVRKAALPTRAKRAIRKSRCRAISISRNGEIRPASNSASVRASTRSWPRFAPGQCPAEAAPLVDGIALPGIERAVISPIDGGAIGVVREGDDSIVRAAMAAAAAGFAAWATTPCDERAAALDRAADLLEKNRGPFLALLQNEGGKTLDDALSELREAVDYCRYYAAQARVGLTPQPMPGPTGESNVLALSRPRRLCLHQPVEFSAGDLSRPGERGARRRQCRRGQTGGADTADRRARGRAVA